MADRWTIQPTILFPTSRMNFHIADTFTTELGKLSAQEQKQAKVAALDLQINPSHPGLQMHRVTDSRDADFWSVRVSRDLRIIVHRTAASFLLAYVDHHDPAYAWARRRRIEAHPRTGAIQIVEIHEIIEQEKAAAPASGLHADTTLAPETVEKPPIFSGLSEDAMLGIGVPADWTSAVITWTEDRFFEMAGRLPSEAAEALLEYASTGQLPTAEARTEDPYDHPDTRRRVQPIADEDELHLALDYPWEKWGVFLHPSQREIVNRTYSGPARVTGTAGTGKTVVALHRAARALQEDEHARVLLSSFSRPLANMLRLKMRVLLGDKSTLLGRISIASFEDAASDLYQLMTGHKPALASMEVQQAVVQKAIDDTGYDAHPLRFVFNEWLHIVDAWNIHDPDAYANVPRVGRQHRLGARQRDRLWPVMERARGILRDRGLLTQPQLFAAIEEFHAPSEDKPFTHVIIDEAQDLSAAELRMMGVLAKGPDALFFAGDIGQRIFQLPFSWLVLGVDVRGRSSSLRVNYRTSRQIRERADMLLPPKVRDVDGIEEDRRHAQSVFEGPEPVICEYVDQAAEIEGVTTFLRDAISSDFRPEEIGVFVRSVEQIPRARDTVHSAGLQTRQLSDDIQTAADHISIGTMHLAKGLEFRLVIVMACDDEVLPLQSRIDQVTTDSELNEIYDTERHLLYVACTRARDRLHVSGVSPMSEFLSDLGPVTTRLRTY